MYPPIQGENRSDPISCWAVSVAAGVEDTADNGSPIVTLWVTSLPIHFSDVVSCVLCRASAAGDQTGAASKSRK
ncbi:hypothetical protein AB205_0033110 [Aquarana catesbeiana]|uniref:Uncharacterized protein n=1 Tax=Aquarana catesbeiana TaxID=8400 RepID=A0A2G9S8W7_AQUCT|nr:hypothetical protein AB205_0033110 [Aquarana catesbeiana]